MGKLDVVVTGGAGFIGAETVLELRERGHSVTIIDPKMPGWNSEPGTAGRLCGLVVNGEVVQVRKQMGVEKIEDREWGEPDVIVHLAARTDVRSCADDPAGSMRANAGGVGDVMLAAQAIGRRRHDGRVPAIVFASSAAVKVEERAGGYVGAYGRSKLVGEEMLATMERAVCLRYENVTSERGGGGVARVMCQEAAALGRITVHGDGKQRRDFLTVGEAAHVTRRVTEWAAGQERVNVSLEIGTGRTRSVLEVAEDLARRKQVRLEFDRSRTEMVMESRAEEHWRTVLRAAGVG